MSSVILTVALAIGTGIAFIKACVDLDLGDISGGEAVAFVLFWPVWLVRAVWRGFVILWKDK